MPQANRVTNRRPQAVHSIERCEELMRTLAVHLAKGEYTQSQEVLASAIRELQADALCVGRADVRLVSLAEAFSFDLVIVAALADEGCHYVGDLDGWTPADFARVDLLGPKRIRLLLAELRRLLRSAA